MSENFTNNNQQSSSRRTLLNEPAQTEISTMPYHPNHHHLRNGHHHPIGHQSGLRLLSPSSPSAIKDAQVPSSSSTSTLHQQQQTAADENQIPPSSSSSKLNLSQWTDDTIESSIPRKTCYRVTLEIISARTLPSSSEPGSSFSSSASSSSSSSTASSSSASKFNTTTNNKSKYVSYSIVVKRSPGLEPHPGLIERRYTDFYNLFISLRKTYPDLLSAFPFPKKMLMGNFTADLIKQRSIAFQHLLVYCLSVDELRRTRTFHAFLYERELRDSRRLLRAMKFEELTNIFENIYFILEKLLLLHNDEIKCTVFRVLIIFIACLYASENNLNEAKIYLDVAVNLLLQNDNEIRRREYLSDELLSSFLLLAINIYKKFNNDNYLIEHLQLKLNQLLINGLCVERLTSFLDAISKLDLIAFILNTV